MDHPGVAASKEPRGGRPPAVNGFERAQANMGGTAENSPFPSRGGISTERGRAFDLGNGGCIMVHEKVDSSLNFVDREKDVLDFWKRERIFEKSMELREGNPVFTFYDGPPTANGKPHVGHLLTRSIKDLIPRYRTMKGDWVLRKAGWDTHGLPVELEVEKLLGLDGKPQIEEYGVAPFIDE